MNTMPAPTAQNLLAPTLAPLETEPRRAMDRLKEMGFRHVQLSAAMPGMRPRELNGSARRDLAAALRRKELIAAGIDIWVPPSHFLDSAEVDRAASAVLETIEMAGDLGRCPVSLTLPTGGDEQEKGQIDAVAKSLIRHCEHWGVELADHAIPVADRLGIGVGIDPAAWLGQGEDPAAIVSRNADRLISARLCDLLTSGMRGPIGDTQEGRLDVVEYRVAISIGVPDRPIVVDTRQWTDQWAGLGATAEVWQRA